MTEPTLFAVNSVPVTFRRLRKALALGLSVRALAARDYENYHHSILSADLEAEIEFYKEHLNHGKSASTIEVRVSCLRRWFRYLESQEPTPELARAFLEYLKNNGYPASSVYLYRLSIVDYLEMTGPDIGKIPDNCLYRNVEGKGIRIYATGKRTRPHRCELCGGSNTSSGKGIRLKYHHWDDTDFSKGLWLCSRCHQVAEAVDSGTVSIYMKLKFLIGESNKQQAGSCISMGARHE